MVQKLLLLLLGVLLIPACQDGVPEAAVVFLADSDGDGGQEVWALSAVGVGSQLHVWEPYNGLGYDLSWSPDRRYVLTSGYNPGLGHSQIWILPIDGSPGIEVLQGAGLFEYGWAPDSSRLAFSTLGSPHQAHTIRPDGSDLVTLGEGGRARWTPDSARLAYSAPDGIRIVMPDGTGSVLVGQGTWFEWAPDGSRLAFVTTPLPGALMTCPPSGAPLTQVSVPPAVTEFSNGSSSPPKWSPDSSRLAYFGPQWSKEHPLIVTRGDSDQECHEVDVPEGSRVLPYSSWSPDGSCLAVSGYQMPPVYPYYDPFLRFHDPNGALLWQPRGMLGAFWSPTGLIMGWTVTGTPGMVLLDPRTRTVEFIDPELGISPAQGVWNRAGDKHVFWGTDDLWLWRKGRHPGLQRVGRGHAPVWKSDGDAFYAFQDDNLIVVRDGRWRIVFEHVNAFVPR